MNLSSWDFGWGLYNACLVGYDWFGEMDWKRRRILYLQNQYFLNVFCSRFDYEGFSDETLDIVGKNQLFEVMLYFSPSVAWFKDPIMGLQCLPTTGQYDFNIAGMPTRWKVFGMNGFTKELDYKNSVLMFNDRSYSIPFLRVLYELGYMVDLDFTHKQQIMAQRKPLLMEIEEDEKKTAQSFLGKLKNFADTIAVRVRAGKTAKSRMGVEAPFNMQVFDTHQEFQGRMFMDDFKEFENRILTYFGINNVNIEKRERLLTGEVSANDMLIQMNFTSALQTRQEAFEKVRKILGEDITVKPKDLQSLQSALTSEYQFAGGNIPNGNGQANDNGAGNASSRPRSNEG